MNTWYNTHERLVKTAASEAYLNRLSVKQLKGHITYAILSACTLSNEMVSGDAPWEQRLRPPSPGSTRYVSPLTSHKLDEIVQMLKLLMRKGERDIGKLLLATADEILVDMINPATQDVRPEDERRNMRACFYYKLRDIMQTHYSELNAVRQEVSPQPVQVLKPEPTLRTSSVKTSAVVKSSIPRQALEELVLKVVPIDVASAYREWKETCANIDEWQAQHTPDSFEGKMQQHIAATLADAEHELKQAMHGADDIFLYARNLMVKRIRDQRPIPAWAKTVFGLKLPSYYKQLSGEWRVSV